MRWYWIRILAGALAVFLAGLAVVWLVRDNVVRPVGNLTRSADPIRIPLAFVPFMLDGERYGTFQRLTIARESPRIIQAFHIRVRLTDSIAPASLAGCRLTTASPTGFNLSEGFRCLTPDASDSGLVAFGEVRLVGQGSSETTVPLLLDEIAVQSLREAGEEVTRTQRELMVAEEAAAKAEAQRIRLEVKVKTDSIARAVRERVQDGARPPSAPPGGVP